MPRKQVTAVFQEYFLTEKFVINQDTAFRLTQRNPSELKSECKDRRGLSRKLAKADLYASNKFTSISDVFNVSIEAMAIRLEELNLVEF